MKGLTCKGFATRSESGWKVNMTLSPQGVFVTCHQFTGDYNRAYEFIRYQAK
jgi:hypothetical protein